MRLTKLVGAIVLLLPLAGCVHVVVHPPDEPLRSEQTDAWLTEVVAVARTGDWIVLRGYHASDHVVATATNYPLSHVAIIDQERGEVIEAVGSGVQTRALRERIHEAHRVVILRPRWWTAKHGGEAVIRARALIGEGYDFLGTIGAGSDERYYCSELAIHVYAEYHDATEDFPSVIKPADMFRYGDVTYDSDSRD